MKLEWWVRLVERQCDDSDLAHINLAEVGVTPLGKGCRQVAHRRLRGVVTDRHVGNEGVRSIGRDGDKIPQAVMDASAPTVVMHIEKRRIAERVDAAEADREGWKRSDWVACKRDEFIKPVDAQLVTLLRVVDDEAEFLKGDVEKVIRVQTDE